MPLREVGCEMCGAVVEFYHPSTDPAIIPLPGCSECGREMKMLLSVPHLDTSDTFHPFDWHNPDTGKDVRISNLHQLRKIEHASLATGRNIRFDAYSAEPSNPDAIDGFGLEHWDGNHKSTKGKAFALPIM